MTTWLAHLPLASLGNYVICAESQDFPVLPQWTDMKVTLIKIHGVQFSIFSLFASDDGLVKMTESDLHDWIIILKVVGDCCDSVRASI